MPCAVLLHSFLTSLRAKINSPNHKAQENLQLTRVDLFLLSPGLVFVTIFWQTPSKYSKDIPLDWAFSLTFSDRKIPAHAKVCSLQTWKHQFLTATRAIFFSGDFH
jgi:hypothetical protein